MDEKKTMIFLCDGKVPKCSGYERCYLSEESLRGDRCVLCCYTDDIDHAINFRPIADAGGGDTVVYAELRGNERLALSKQLQIKT